MQTTGNAAVALDWKTGPRDIALLDQAIVKLPRDFAYLEQNDARQLLRKLGNPDAGNVTGLFAGPGGNWLLVVRFNKSGYIKTSEVPDWKLDELFNALKQSTDEANALRKKNGMSETELVGWIEKPDYDVKKHRLIWAISSREKGGKLSDFQSVNFNIYLLGREGYFDFSLVTDLAQLAQNKKYASTLVSAISFRDGKKYGDFKKGKDKVAPYGVTELVSIGGAMEKAEQNHDSKFVRFIKVFSLILLVIVALAGAAFGIFYFLRKRRIAKLEAEVAAPEAAEAAAPK
jgi:uncharacterized membrane-anchored protein